MKTTKKVFALILSLVMALAMASTALAAEITITNAVEDQVYNAYKIFDVTTTDAEPTEDTGYAYTIANDSQWKAAIDSFTLDGTKVFTLTPSASDPTTLVVTWIEAFKTEDAAAKFAEHLNSNLSGKTATKTVTAEKVEEGTTSSAVFSDLTPGYYFVDSSLGALCALKTATTTQEITEKNSEPDIDKKIMDPGELTETTASVGDTVKFQLKVTPGGKADTSYIVHDTMTDGLTLTTDSFVITKGGTAVNAADYTIKTTGTTDSCTFEIEFKQSYTATLTKDDVITIAYSAVLNDNAIDDTMTETNTVHLSYGNTHSTEVTVTVKTFKFDVVKTDKDNKVLTGAQFELYNALTGGTKIDLIKDADGPYRPATAAEKAVEGFTSAIIPAGEATITGLEAGKYYLEETVAPAGYNKLTARQEVDLTGGSIADAVVNTGVYASGGVQVVNQTGVELPSTGGIGTTIFYIVGSLLMAGAVVLLVTKKKMSGSEV